MDLFLAKDETANLVKGPNDLPGLFQWASFNAKTLFTDAIHKKSFESLVANTDFEIYDLFCWKRQWIYYHEEPVPCNDNCIRITEG